MDIRESAVFFSNREPRWLLISYGLEKDVDFLRKPPTFLIQGAKTSQTTGGVSAELSVMAETSKAV
jgi:hypothetical protein